MNKDRHHSGVNHGLMTDMNIKNRLIEMLYNMIDVAKLRYKILEYKSDLPLLKQDRHYVSPNYNGANCFLFFAKFNRNYYSLLIERKTLSYNPSQVDMQRVKMIPVNVRLGYDIYNGTIMDGIRLQNNHQSKATFIIGDVYFLCGKKLMDQKLNHKLMNINAYLANNLSNSKYDSINLEVSYSRSMAEIVDVINTDFPNMANKDSIRGLIFYPETSGTKLIFNNTSFSGTTSAVKKCAKKEVKAKKDELYTFEVRMVDTDVYKLYLREKCIENGKKIIKKVKIGLASTPTIDCCHLCKQLTENGARALIDCKYDQDSKTWVPIKKSTMSKPSYVSDIDDTGKITK
jgi:hypothetical protein